MTLNKLFCKFKYVDTLYLKCYSYDKKLIKMYLIVCYSMKGSMVMWGPVCVVYSPDSQIYEDIKVVKNTEDSSENQLILKDKPIDN